jgi:hypothetical protein
MIFQLTASRKPWSPDIVTCMANGQAEGEDYVSDEIEIFVAQICAELRN